MRRQSYYARRKRRRRRQVDGDLVVEMVRAERALQPRLGTRKLHHLVKEPMEEAGAKVGRDRLFETLRERG